ncbi:hypothetical protein [Nonomuraea dietziae]|uniref:Uncharacterized protein n=1 Tax=Nonomuraea dietziae TaxID=65515 RepID=A0A7W5V9S9_9ACTN|nr:hypothetical protein [Nonomuraea dietziae]MBB3727864.1 hypothetical protein [Nonomuraea dietziae]
MLLILPHRRRTERRSPAGESDEGRGGRDRQSAERRSGAGATVRR